MDTPIDSVGKMHLLPGENFLQLVPLSMFDVSIFENYIVCTHTYVVEIKLRLLFASLHSQLFVYDARMVAYTIVRPTIVMFEY